MTVRFLAGKFPSLLLLCLLPQRGSTSRYISRESIFPSYNLVKRIDVLEETSILGGKSVIRDIFAIIVWLVPRLVFAKISWYANWNLMLFFALASVYYFYRLFGVNTARSRTLLRAASASSSLEAVGIQWYQRSHHLLLKKVENWQRLKDARWDLVWKGQMWNVRRCQWQEEGWDV